MSRGRRQPTALDRAFGTILFQRRCDLKIRQSEVAARIGVSQSILSRLEKGRNVLEVARARRWAIALELDFVDTFAAAVAKAEEWERLKQ